MQTLLQNATIVDATSPDPRPGNILIEGGLIRDLNAGVPTSTCQIIDVKGRTVIPGLIDCHVQVVTSMMDLAANAQLPAPPPSSAPSPFSKACSSADSHRPRPRRRNPLAR